MNEDVFLVPINLSYNNTKLGASSNEDVLQNRMPAAPVI